MAVVFLDRDGVINADRADYVKGWQEFQFLPRSLRALQHLTSAGHRLYVVTNQSCINRGVVQRETIDDIHRRMAATIEKHGGRIEGILVCPHRPDEGCRCRKPASGLLVEAARRFDIRLQDSFFVGDRLSDVEAAISVDAYPILVTGENPVLVEDVRAKHVDVTIVVDLWEAALMLASGLLVVGQRS